MLLCRSGRPHARSRDPPHERRATGGSTRASAAGSPHGRWLEDGTDDAGAALYTLGAPIEGGAHLDAGTLTAQARKLVEAPFPLFDPRLVPGSQWPGAPANRLVGDRVLAAAGRRSSAFSGRNPGILVTRAKRTLEYRIINLSFTALREDR